MICNFVEICNNLKTVHFYAILGRISCLASNQKLSTWNPPKLLHVIPSYKSTAVRSCPVCHDDLLMVLRSMVTQITLPNTHTTTPLARFPSCLLGAIVAPLNGRNLTVSTSGPTSICLPRSLCI